MSNNNEEITRYDINGHSLNISLWDKGDWCKYSDIAPMKDQIEQLTIENNRLDTKIKALTVLNNLLDKSQKEEIKQLTKERDDAVVLLEKVYNKGFLLIARNEGKTNHIPVSLYNNIKKFLSVLSKDKGEV